MKQGQNREDGKVFAYYKPYYTKAGKKIFEAWLTPEKFSAYLSRRATYSKSPEERARRRAFSKTPEGIAKRRAHAKSPAAVASSLAYRMSPEGAAKRIAYAKTTRALELLEARRNRPENIAKRRAATAKQNKTAAAIQARKDYALRPENIAKDKARRAAEEYRAKRRLAMAEKRKSPEWKAHNAAYNRERYLSDPAHNLKRRVIRAIRHALYFERQYKSKTLSSTEAVAFLKWLLSSTHESNLSGLDVDHVIPVSKWVDGVYAYTLNSPENLQLLEARTNRYVKRDCMPTPQEIAAHLMLVAAWRTSICSSQQTAT